MRTSCFRRARFVNPDARDARFAHMAARSLRAFAAAAYHRAMLPTLPDAADPERDLDLVVVGEINPDVVVTDPDPVPAFGQAERMVESIRLVPGSSSVIAAMGAAHLGLRVAMVGVVGDDALGRFMLDALAGRGIDVSACRVAAGRPTGASVILGNERDRAILTALGTIADVRASDVPAGLLARARHVHVGSYFLQPGLAADVPALFRAAHAAGATTSLDPNWDPSGRWDSGFAAAAAGADILLPNAAEACRLTGLDDVEAAARALAGGGGPFPGTRIPGTRIVAVKDGARGGLALGPAGSVVRATALPVTPVDTTGAGDSFDAGFLAAFLAGRSIAAGLALAVACGSLSTRSPGGTDGQPTLEEAEAALRG
jgi:sugar/nucleoside kinase (ribokinase family)